MKTVKEFYKIKGDGNVYVITKPVPLVIDTGRQSEREKLKKEIEKIIPLNEIKMVLFTHLHYDHSENASLFENAEFYASEEEIEDIRKNPFLFFINPNSDVVQILKKKLKPLPEKIGGLEVIKVPGHTRGCVAFMDKKKKILYTGDTLFNGRIGRTDLPNSVPSEMYNSVQRLRDLIYAYNLEVCPGHDY